MEVYLLLENSCEKVSKCIFDISLKQRLIVVPSLVVRCEKVSKCIFDISLKQLLNHCLVLSQSCEKVSKCIFDISLKQPASLYPFVSDVVKRFQNVSLT